MEKTILRATAFVLRCSGSAAVIYELASSLGLHEALWAVMSALIVSQEQLHQTRSSFCEFISGTLLGIGVTVAVSEAASRMAISTAVQIALAVAICALVVHKFPMFRVAMWTCPLVLLTAQPSVPVVLVALRRGSEVILGAIVGWAFHWIAEVIVNTLEHGAVSLRGRRAVRHVPVRCYRQHRLQNVEGDQP